MRVKYYIIIMLLAVSSIASQISAQQNATLSALLAVASTLNQIPAQQNSILSAVKSEVDRSKAELKLNNLRPPFLISYTVADIKVTSIAATAGALVSVNDNNYRAGLSKFFVGDYANNNSNFGNFMSVRDISMDDDAKGIAIAIWGDMDRLYKNA
ncbi:MAG: hypothetical protein LBT35_05625, partial [Tannerella sp.]|nr:hypothetical protein [Tannerella sp.]